MDAEGLPAHLSGDVEGLLRETVPGELQGVRRDASAKRLQDFGGGSEKAIGGDESIERPVGPAEIIAVDEQADPLSRILEVEKDRGLDALPPERAPESFDLPEGLGMLRGRDDVTDAALLQLAGEGALPAPCDVLA